LQQLNAAQPIVNADGTMSQAFRDRMNLLTRYLPLAGEGSPEGVFEAPQFSLYLDTLGAPGSIEYRKMLPDIGGDKSMGWLAV